MTRCEGLRSSANKEAVGNGVVDVYSIQTVELCFWAVFVRSLQSGCVAGVRRSRCLRERYKPDVLASLSLPCVMASQKLLGLPPVPPELKSTTTYLQRAEELKVQDPVVAYWCTSLSMGLFTTFV